MVAVVGMLRAVVTPYFPLKMLTQQQAAILPPSLLPIQYRSALLPLFELPMEYQSAKFPLFELLIQYWSADLNF